MPEKKYKDTVVVGHKYKLVGILFGDDDCIDTMGVYRYLLTANKRLYILYYDVDRTPIDYNSAVTAILVTDNSCYNYVLQRYRDIF